MSKCNCDKNTICLHCARDKTFPKDEGGVCKHENTHLVGDGGMYTSKECKDCGELSSSKTAENEQIGSLPVQKEAKVVSPSGEEWGKQVIAILEEAYSRNDLGEVWAVAELNSLLSQVSTDSFNRGKEEALKEVEQKIEWLIPIAGKIEEYVEIVKTGNMDKMYDYGFKKAKEMLSNSLKKI